MDIKDMCEHNNGITTISDTIPHEAQNLWLKINQQFAPTRSQL
jgi:hypothetical protein